MTRKILMVSIPVALILALVLFFLSGCVSTSNNLHVCSQANPPEWCEDRLLIRSERDSVSRNDPAPEPEPEPDKPHHDKHKEFVHIDPPNIKTPEIRGFWNR